MKVSRLVTLDAYLIEEFTRIGGNLSGTLNELLEKHLENNAEFIKKSLKESENAIKVEKKKQKRLKNELKLAQERMERNRKMMEMDKNRRREYLFR